MSFTAIFPALGKRKLVTKTFAPPDTSFTVPFGVSKLESVTGKGSDGAAAVFASQTLNLVFCSLTGSPGSATVSAASAAAYASSQAALFDGAGVRSVTYASRNYQIDSSDLVNTFDTSLSAIVSGAGELTIGQTSGNLTQSNFSSNFGRYSISVQQSPASNGASTTGFGQNFAGGIGGPAGASTVNNVNVTENTAYPLSIPAGGSLTITYYK